VGLWNMEENFYFSNILYSESHATFDRG